MQTIGKKDFTGEEVLVESQGMQDSINLEDNEDNFLSVTDRSGTLLGKIGSLGITLSVYLRKPRCPKDGTTARKP